MVGHGGYWTRLEFERVPFFDIFDPETEPLYPAPLHTDLQPLVAGQPKVIWLRPQMYESVPYERWRYHVYVELIRGVRGWQIAHGPGDASTFRGLHAELRQLQPAIYSTEKPTATTIEPPLEHLTRRLGRKTYIVVATTHGMSFGNWRWSAERSEHGRARETAATNIVRDESEGYRATGEPRAQTLVLHGIQNLIHPRKWPAGTKLVTWLKLDERSTPKNVVALVKADGRWTHAATWGAWDLDVMRRDNQRTFWLLHDSLSTCPRIPRLGQSDAAVRLGLSAGEINRYGRTAAGRQVAEAGAAAGQDRGNRKAGGRRRVPSRGGKGLLGSDYADQRRR